MEDELFSVMSIRSHNVKYSARAAPQYFTIRNIYVHEVLDNHYRHAILKFQVVSRNRNERVVVHYFRQNVLSDRVVIYLRI